MFAVLVLAGIAVTMFPVGETFVNNAQGAEGTRDYVERVAAQPPEVLSEALVRAQAYNEALKPELLTDPWEERGTQGTAEHDAYLGQLADQEYMGRLRIPQIKVDLPIMHDAYKPQLARGIGHMYGSSLPVGGPGTNAVLAGHTGSRARVFLDRLIEVGLGEDFYVDVYGRTLTYRVKDIKVVSRYDLAAVARTPGEDLVTLVTCTDGGRLRLLVVGARVPDVTADSPAGADAAGDDVAMASNAGRTGTPPVTYDDSLQEWMLPRLAVAGAGVVLLVGVGTSWIIAGFRRRGSAEERPASRPAPGSPSAGAHDHQEPEEALA